MSDTLYIIGEILLYVGAMVLGAYFVYTILVSPTVEVQSERNQVETQGKRFFERRSKELPDRRRNRKGDPPRGVERRKKRRRSSDL